MNGPSNNQTDLGRGQSPEATKDSKTLAKTGNKKIGRRSEDIDLGGCIYGAGITIAHFQMSGGDFSLSDHHHHHDAKTAEVRCDDSP